MSILNKVKVSTIALGIFAAAGAHASLIHNGSFETPEVGLDGDEAGGAWSIYYDGDVDGWTSSLGSDSSDYGIEIQENGTLSGVTAHSGDQYVELDTTQNSFMFQEVNGLVVGEFYTFSFWYQPRTERQTGSTLPLTLNPNDNGIDVYWGDFNSLDQTDSIANEFVGEFVADDDSGWALYEYDVQATDETMLFGFFAGGDSNSYGGLIDDVSLVAVPEPSAIALFGLGILGLGVARRRVARA